MIETGTSERMTFVFFNSRIFMMELLNHISDENEINKLVEEQRIETYIREYEEMILSYDFINQSIYPRRGIIYFH